MVTVLLSAFNEAKNPFFWKTVDTVRSLTDEGHPIRLVVGVTPGSDDTLMRLTDLEVPHVQVQSSLRAVRYNEAFRSLTFQHDEWILLHHPRSVLESDAFLELARLPGPRTWGAFTHDFDTSHPLLTFTSWWSNFVRGDLRRIFYLDHCLFVRSSHFQEIGGVPELEIFEDTVLSKKLSKLQAPIRLPWKSTTSAVRFQTNGIWNQAWKNQVLKWKFYLKANDEVMNLEYESGVDLNSKGKL